MHLKIMHTQVCALKSTPQFMKQVRQFKFNKKQIMVSFNVVSLFTNVPLYKTIEIIANRLYPDDPPLNQLSIQKSIQETDVLCSLRPFHV